MKKTQFGGAAVVALIAIVALIIGVAGIGFASYVNAYNFGNTMEVQLVKIRDNNKNIYAQGTQKVLEIAQVPGMYTEDFSKIVTADIQGRYGKDGSKATMQWLKEHDIKLDTAMYVKIQQTIEAFRNEFQNAQTHMIDVRGTYQTQLGSFWTGMWMRFAGYPKIDMKQFDPITTSKTEKVYQDGKEEGPLKLR